MTRYGTKFCHATHRSAAYCVSASLQSEACQTASHVQRWLCKEGDGSAEELFEPCRLESNWERGFKVVEFEVQPQGGGSEGLVSAVPPR